MNNLFTVITRQDNEDALGFYKRIAATVTGRPAQDAWAGSEVIVTEGYESPYRFGRELRAQVDDHSATVFRFHTADRQPLYVAFGPSGAAVYDPSQRSAAQRPVEIDYYAAADALS